MTDSSFAAMTTITYTRERATLAGGFSGSGTPSLLGTPVAPVDAETRKRLQLETPITLWEVHMQGNPDLKAGDKLVNGSIKYNIKTKEPYTWLPTNDIRVRLILEDVRN